MSKTEARLALQSKHRLVIKIGSAVLTQSGEGDLRKRIAGFCLEFNALIDQGYQLLVVTSGAVAAGMERLGLKARPKSVTELQAIAAVGQMSLMQAYERELSSLDRVSSMVLLTHDDFSNRKRYLNARATLRRLIDLKVIPVINENDTVATEEIRFGDNDTLSALVTNLVEADLQIILTDVEGLMDKDPNMFSDARKVSEVRADDRSLENLSSTRTSELGRGGMLSKVRSARLASRSGADTVIASGNVPGVLGKILAGDDIGSLLVSQSESLKSRKRWIADQLKPVGKIVIDSGAASVIAGGGSSLLAVGVLEVTGEFDRGDLVECWEKGGGLIAQGLVNYSASDVKRLKGLNSHSYPGNIEYVYEDELIHCDNLVIV